MIVNFEQNACLDKVGNKGKSLILLKQNGFNVPNGFVLDSDCCDELLGEKSSQISALLAEINTENIDSTIEKISCLLDDLAVGEDIENLILENIDPCKKYAVRSSATKEDLESFSFAGQYSTFLNVQGIEEIKQAVMNCCKSVFSKGNISYLINNGISFENLKMAVVIQEMVESELSGIAFTVNPLSGDDKEILIEVGEGLGESVVSGKAKPQQYYFNWYSKKYIPPKENPLLEEAAALSMAETFLKVQELFGYPCDIEFALKDGELYLLQARAITKIKYSSFDYMWSTGNYKDGGVSATVCTPYMWSLYEYVWEYTLKKYINDSALLKPQEIKSKLNNMFFGRPYWNMSVVKDAMSQIPGYTEREFDSEYGIDATYEGDGKTTPVNLRSLLRLVQIALRQKRILKNHRGNAESTKEDLLKKYELYKEKADDETDFEQLKATWYKLTHEDYFLSENTYFLQVYINTVHQSLYRNSLLKYVDESGYLSLLSGIDNISHMLPFYDMWEITRKIRQSGEALAFWKNTADEDIIKLADSGDFYLPELKSFVEKYGYHSDKELDVTYPCYCESSASLVKAFKDQIESDDSFSPLLDRENQSREYEKQLNKIKAAVGKRKYKKLFKKICSMREMLWWREEFKDISTRFYCIIRLYTLKLAEHFIKENIIDGKDDIWMLKVGDLWDFIDGKTSRESLREIIAKNRRYYMSFRNYTSENEIGSALGESASFSKKADSSICGIGCNNGTVIATARVINSLEEIDRIREGDILVTRFTDTGWTCKFSLLSGIVTEYGGILCHCAIVSREYGIPCIVCCSNATKKIKDSARIKIDGAKGTVEILEE